MKKNKTAEPSAHAATPSVDNRRARFQYHILESLEAGIALTGTEIKSVRQGGVSLNEAFARLREEELWLVNMHVPPYKEGSFSNHEPRRPRKLLLHRDQIAKLGSRAAEKGLTIIPLRLYFTRGKVKVEIGLAKGKKLWDKRRATAERDAKRDLARIARR
ncbi:MAG: SsrA-binding protein SmpB [Candidatus Eremiobacteraeota bacterium]|nr:SsrA-binding protein SmpB [Candidatus Eremiobacteraeota bacterium]